MTTERRAWSHTCIAVVAILAAGFVSAGAAEPKTYYVSTAGNDDHAGTEAEPLLTIQKAADRARAGDTIVLRGGTYAQTVVLRFSGEKDKPITLVSRKGERAVIQPVEKGREPPDQAVLLQAEAGHRHAIGWINIEGVDIRHGYDGVKMYNAHDVVIRDCRIHDSWNQGILASGNRVLIDRNVIAGSGRDPEGDPSLKHGIYAVGTRYTITNNVIHSNPAYGIQVAAYDYKPEEMAGPEYAEAKDWLIANNTLAFNKVSSGIVLWQDGVENCQIVNNIFYKNGGANGVTFYTQKGRRHGVRNNVFFPPGENLAATEPDTHEAADNREVDPLFADPESFDFHLERGSPAIDAGADLAGRRVRADFEGDARPQGKGFDVGADEVRHGGRASAGAGPLRVHPDNPRYFSDGTGRAVYLAGSHTWNVLQDSTEGDAGPFNYDAYLELLRRHDHNFFRMWVRVGTGGGPPTPVPTVYARPGPGKAVDGLPKYDLTRFNEDFFRRLRTRVKSAGHRGIYVAVMFFGGDNVVDAGGNPNWPLHPYHKGNNVNGIDGDPNGDGQGTECYALAVPAVTALQEQYVGKVIDAVGDLDNVIWEVGNELPGTLEFANHIVRVVKEHERTRPKQHPVGISTFADAKPPMKDFGDTPADWVTPDLSSGGDYQGDPPAADGKRVVISDTDHLWGVGGDAEWVWKSFTRGLHPTYMDPLDADATREGARRAMGQTRCYAERINLAAMKPAGGLASTKFCLADPAREYLVYLPTGGAVTVDLSAAQGELAVEWFDPNNGKATGAGPVAGGSRRELTPPFRGPAVLYMTAKAGP